MNVFFVKRIKHVTQLINSNRYWILIWQFRFSVRVIVRAVSLVLRKRNARLVWNHSDTASLEVTGGEMRILALEIFNALWAQKTRWCPCHVVKNNWCDAHSFRHKIPQCNRRTNRQTDRIPTSLSRVSHLHVCCSTTGFYRATPTRYWCRFLSNCLSVFLSLSIILLCRNGSMYRQTLFTPWCDIAVVFFFSWTSITKFRQ